MALDADPDTEITLAVDVAPVWGQKRAAVHRHRSQAAESSILRAPSERQRLFLGMEHFVPLSARSLERGFLNTMIGDSAQ